MKIIDDEVNVDKKIKLTDMNEPQGRPMDLDVLDGTKDRPSPRESGTSAILSLFRCAEKRRCGGGDSGKIRDLGNQLEEVHKSMRKKDEAKREFEASALLIVAEIQESSCRFKKSIKQVEETCTGTIRVLEAADSSEQNAFESNAAAEDARAVFQKSLLPLSAWAIQQGATDDSVDALTRWLKLSASSRPEGSATQTIKAWVEGERKVTATRSTLGMHAWLQGQLIPPEEADFATGVDAFEKKEGAGVDVADAVRAAERARFSADRAKEQALTDIPKALSRLDEFESWVHTTLALYEESSSARSARNAVLVEINARRTSLSLLGLKIEKLAGGALASREQHAAKMANKCASNRAEQDAARHQRESQALRTQLEKGNDAAHQRHQELQKQLQEAKQRENGLADELKKLQEEQEKTQLQQVLNLSSKMPSVTSKHEIFSRNSRPMPTCTDASGSSSRAKLLGGNLIDGLLPGAEQLLANEPSAEIWGRRVKQTLLEWEALVAVDKVIAKSGRMISLLRIFKGELENMLMVFGDNWLVQAQQLRLLNAKNPAVCEDRLRTSFAPKWDTLRNRVILFLDGWLDRIPKVI